MIILLIKISNKFKALRTPKKKQKREGKLLNYTNNPEIIMKLHLADPIFKKSTLLPN